MAKTSCHVISFYSLVYSILPTFTPLLTVKLGSCIGAISLQHNRGCREGCRLLREVTMWVDFVKQTDKFRSNYSSFSASAVFSMEIRKDAASFFSAQPSLVKSLSQVSCVTTIWYKEGVVVNWKRPWIHCVCLCLTFICCWFMWKVYKTRRLRCSDRLFFRFGRATSKTLRVGRKIRSTTKTGHKNTNVWTVEEARIINNLRSAFSSISSFCRFVRTQKMQIIKAVLQCFSSFVITCNKQHSRQPQPITGTPKWTHIDMTN